MISDKYTKQFYQFTEQNITGMTTMQGTGFQLKYFLCSLSVALIFGVGAVYMWPSDERMIAQAEPDQTSVIPMFRVLAKRQVLQAMPLRKAEQIASNEADPSSESWVVMDKVIVIPKVIG